MKDMSLEAVWQTFEFCLAMLESGQGEQSQLNLAIRDCVALLLEYPPAEVVARAENSILPTRAIVSWLVFEAGKLGEDRRGQATLLKEYWEGGQGGGEGIIEAVPSQMV